MSFALNESYLSPDSPTPRTLQQQSSWLEATPEEETPSEAGSDGSAVSTGERRLHDALAATVDRLETTTADLASSRHLIADME